MAKAVVPVLILSEVVHWSDKLTAAVMFLIGVAVTSLTTIFTRQLSVPTKVADRQIEIAKAASIDTPTQEIIQKAKETA